MSDFKPINTQEEFEEVIKERLRRINEKYRDYDDIKSQMEELKGQLSKSQEELQQEQVNKTQYESQIAELNSKIKAYETNSVKMRTALEVGLPHELASRLSGETEDEIREDAQNILNMMNITKPVAPIKSPEISPISTIDEAYKTLIQKNED